MSYRKHSLMEFAFARVRSIKVGDTESIDLFDMKYELCSLSTFRGCLHRIASDNDWLYKTKISKDKKSLEVTRVE